MSAIMLNANALFLIWVWHAGLPMSVIIFT